MGITLVLTIITLLHTPSILAYTSSVSPYTTEADVTTESQTVTTEDSYTPTLTRDIQGDPQSTLVQCVECSSTTAHSEKQNIADLFLGGLGRGEPRCRSDVDAINSTVMCEVCRETDMSFTANVTQFEVDVHIQRLMRGCAGTTVHQRDLKCSHGTETLKTKMEKTLMMETSNWEATDCFCLNPQCNNNDLSSRAPGLRHYHVGILFNLLLALYCV